MPAPSAVPPPTARAGTCRTGCNPTGAQATGRTVATALPVRHRVRFVPGVLDPANPALARAGGPPGRRLVVVEARVRELYGRLLHRYPAAQGVEHETLVLPVHEQVKTMDAVFRVADRMDSSGIYRRGEPVIAIGGGVLADVVGLACSLYRRSTPFVRVPTTLAALVDAGAGAGATTGVDHGRHGNRLGTYHPAADTLLDPAFLATLDRRHLGNGLAEILQVALIKDGDLFGLLERHGRALLDEGFRGSHRAGAEVLTRAVRGMLQDLQPGLREHRPARLTDYGHSFSPTVELRALPELLHGEAVCVDMALTTVVAQRRGLLDPEQAERILRLMRRLELPVWHPLVEPVTLAEALADTVRHRDGRQRLPLPAGIGSGVFVDDLTDGELAGAARWLRDRAAADRVREEHEGREVRA
ncbi:sedoheptulose 7-phosphate cyclase [Streptomyces sp. CB01881]|uniref:sedoheptulose 7-phosphate cyclase n=1 Tax=Streptomyces sp. CB01881 TaxID=2078691 RepID=UPI000CDC6AF6|nr:sedoheptulose 7-phosphate cyclase [Streptomyces sp. CB01881]AUY49050.1 2-epi-5-epi-valiolone synthase [Streptomyces sp. CB01881]TYC77541.1 2-epi-5-epi-valiolone synthase [Streptomyces sp. CB01881]